VIARLRAVASRFDIAAADQKQPVEGLEDLLRLSLFPRRQDRGSRAGPPERVQVGLRDPVAALRPPGHAVIGEVARDDGDQGSVPIIGHGVESSDGSCGLTRRRPGS
jgi:hypothetical protein